MQISERIARVRQRMEDAAKRCGRSANAVALMGADDFQTAADLVTPTERAILEFLEDGLSNKDIARKLDLAPVTVKAHLTRLYRRFGVKTRLELLAYAITHHLITDIALFPSGP